MRAIFPDVLTDVLKGSCSPIRISAQECTGERQTRKSKAMLRAVAVSRLAAGVAAPVATYVGSNGLECFASSNRQLRPCGAISMASGDKVDCELPWSRKAGGVVTSSNLQGMRGSP